MKIVLAALNAHYTHTNLAVRCIRAALRREGTDATVVEMHINLPHRHMLERIAMEKPNLVGFSCYIWNTDQILKLCRSLKALDPGVTVALGGPEAAYRAEEVLRENPSVDYVLTGEGEISFTHLVREMTLGRAPDRGVVEASGVMDASQWPDPYEGGMEGLADRILYAETSRGCPFRCAFCLSSVEGVRALDADEAVRRLTCLADGGARLIKLVDRTFNFDRRRADGIWSALIRHAEASGKYPTYHFEISAQLLDEENYATLSRAPKGLFQFEIGIQSSFEKTLRAVDRNVSFAKLRDAVCRINALGTIHTHVDLIAGLPYEDFGRFARSFDDVYALGADQLQLGFLKVLHGSPLRRRAGELGLVFEPDAPYEILSTPDMSFDDVCRLKDIERLLGWYANSGRYPVTMRLLIRNRSAFSVFHTLAGRMRQGGVFDADRGEKTRADALLRCGADMAPKEALTCALTHDLLSHGLRRELPDPVAFVETEAQRKYLRKQYPPARGKSFAVYAVDLLSLAENAQILQKQTEVVYDPDGGWRIVS